MSHDPTCWLEDDLGGTVCPLHGVPRQECPPFFRTKERYNWQTKQWEPIRLPMGHDPDA